MVQPSAAFAAAASSRFTDDVGGLKHGGWGGGHRTGNFSFSHSVPGIIQSSIDVLTLQIYDSENQRVNAASALNALKMTVGKQCGWILSGPFRSPRGGSGMVWHAGKPHARGGKESRELWRLIKPALARR